MKMFIVGLFLKLLSIGLIAFSLYGLSIQFFFSYFNQSINGPQLTVINFAGPLLLTIAILLLTGKQILFGNSNLKAYSVHIITSVFLIIIICFLLAWQTWYILTLYKMKSSLGLSRIATELLPMLTGLCTTLYLTISIGRRIYAS